MVLNFPPNPQHPDPPQEGDKWDDASNGIPYVYEGGKWQVYLRSSDNINHWVRITEQEGQDKKYLLTPRATDDVLSVKTYDVDRLPTLPNTRSNAFSRLLIGYVLGEQYRGYFHILDDGSFMTGLIGDPNSKKIYATKAESMRDVPGYTVPAGVEIPEASPVYLQGFVYVADDGTLINSGHDTSASTYNNASDSGSSSDPVIPSGSTGSGTVSGTGGY